MRKPNPHQRELVEAVHALILAGRPLRASCDAVLANPPMPLYERLTPTPRTLVEWYLQAYPTYRDFRVKDAKALLKQGQTQAQVAAHFDVTARTIRNWCRSK